MLIVQLGEQIELRTLGRAVDVLGPAQVEDRIADRTKKRPLIRRRHEPIRPVRLPANRPAALVEDDDIAGQVLVLGPQSVHGPTAERRPADDRLPRVHRHQRRTVSMAVCMTRPNHRQLVGMPTHVLEEVRDHQPAVATRSERSERGSQKPNLAASRVGKFLSLGQRLAGEPFEFGLVVKRIDLTRRAIHHQEDHTLRPPKRMRRLRRERVRRRLPFGPEADPLKEALARQQRCQREAGESGSHLPHELTTGLTAGELVGHGDCSHQADEPQRHRDTEKARRETMAVNTFLFSASASLLGASVSLW